MGTVVSMFFLARPIRYLFILLSCSSNNKGAAQQEHCKAPSRLFVPRGNDMHFIFTTKQLCCMTCAEDAFTDWAFCCWYIPLHTHHHHPGPTLSHHELAELSTTTLCTTCRLLVAGGLIKRRILMLKLFLLESEIPRSQFPPSLWKE